jgi:hypothetical protein
MWTFRAVITPLAAVTMAIALGIGSVAVAGFTTVVDADSLEVVPGSAGGATEDADAATGLNLSMSKADTASVTASLPAASNLVVRAAGQRCDGAPVLNVTLDGKSLGTVTVSDPALTDYALPATIASGTHTIAMRFGNGYANDACRRSVRVDTVRVTQAMTTSARQAPPPASAPGRLFTGDYRTGDFAQWPNVQNRTYNDVGSEYAPTYSASIVPDATYGNAARFEVRTGDVPPFGGGERSEVAGGAQSTGGTEGQTRWYAFSTRFDPSFPQNHHDLGWGLTNQWHADAEGSPPLGWYVDQHNGFWSLVVNKQSGPGAIISALDIFDVPLGVGWHDVKMQVHWSASDTAGYVRLWLNGVRQTFADGSDTYHVRTLVPGTTNVYYKEGMYRQSVAPTDIVYHAQFRSATEESGL